MANIYTILDTCPMCGGSGVESYVVFDENSNPSTSTRACDNCSESGRVSVMTVDLTDLEDKINDIVDRLTDIKEILDDM